MNNLDDEQLRNSIAAVRQADSAVKRQLALNALLRKLQKLPGLLKSSHQDYPQALNLVWEWVCKSIDQFRVDDENVGEHLTRWINGYLYWRIHDLYSPDEVYIKLGPDRIKVRHVPLDQPIGEEGEGVTLADRLSKPEEQIGNRFLDSIDRLVQDKQTEERQRLAQKIAQYVRQDPEQKLRCCHPRNQPCCNAQFLAIRLYLQEPPDSYRVLADELQISYQSLVAHWKRACKKLLKTITEELSDKL